MGRYTGDAGNNWITPDFVGGGVTRSPPGTKPGPEYDVLIGAGGNDILAGGGGPDDLWGGPGLDKMWGNAGHDDVYGGAGNDTVYGGAGYDYLNGEAGNDYLNGEAGNDTVYGGAGNDIVYGGTGKDIVYGATGADRFTFSKGDTVLGTVHTDVIKDFKRLEGDKIDLTPTNVSDFGGYDEFPEAGEVSYWSSGKNTIVSFDDGGLHDIVLENLTLHMIASDFVL